MKKIKTNEAKRKYQQAYEAKRRADKNTKINEEIDIFKKEVSNNIKNIEKTEDTEEKPKLVKKTKAKGGKAKQAKTRKMNRDKVKKETLAKLEKDLANAKNTI